MDFNAVATCIAVSAVATALLVAALFPDEDIRPCDCPACKSAREMEEQHGA